MPMPGPTPVKARLLEGLVTTKDPGAVVVAPPGVVVGGLVVVVGAAAVVVVVDPVPATAITGEMGLAVGAEVTMPEGVTESLG